MIRKKDVKIVFLKEIGGRQHKVRLLCGLVHADVHAHEKIEFRYRLLESGCVREEQRRIPCIHDEGTDAIR